MTRHVSILHLQKAFFKLDGEKSSLQEDLHRLQECVNELSTTLQVQKELGTEKDRFIALLEQQAASKDEALRIETDKLRGECLRLNEELKFARCVFLLVYSVF